MTIKMKSPSKTFQSIKNGTKTYEIRLLDEKRSKLKVGDTIKFRKLPELTETIDTKVTKLIKTDTFEQLFKQIDPLLAGWPSNTDPKQCAKDLEKYYPLSEQREYGVVGIEVKVL